MEDFTLGYGPPPQARAPPSNGVEWYSSGAGGYDAGMDYSYNAGPSSATAFATFDDEPPLLEGDRRHATPIDHMYLLCLSLPAVQGYPIWWAPTWL